MCRKTCFSRSCKSSHPCSEVSCAIKLHRSEPEEQTFLLVRMTFWMICIIDIIRFETRWYYTVSSDIKTDNDLRPVYDLWYLCSIKTNGNRFQTQDSHDNSFEKNHNRFQTYFGPTMKETLVGSNLWSINPLFWNQVWNIYRMWTKPENTNFC